MTLEEAQEIVIAGAQDAGVVCPCCKQFAKVYQRTITSAMARALIEFYWLHQQNGSEWVHAPSHKWIAWPRDHAKLAYWGLIEEKYLSGDEQGTSSGYWRILQKGMAFVEGKISLPKYAHVYNGRVIGLDDKERITIEDALKNKFDYRALMAR